MPCVSAIFLRIRQCFASRSAISAGGLTGGSRRDAEDAESPRRATLRPLRLRRSNGGYGTGDRGTRPTTATPAARLASTARVTSP